MGIFGAATEENGELRQVVIIVKSTSVHGKERTRTEANLLCFFHFIANVLLNCLH